MHKNVETDIYLQENNELRATITILQLENNELHATILQLENKLKKKERKNK